MKSIYSILVVTICILHCQLLHSQVETNYYAKDQVPSKIKEALLFAKDNQIQSMPAFDLKSIQEEDKLLDGIDKPYRFGYAFDVSYSLADGKWRDVENGRIWSMTFESKGAQTLNFVFEDFSLPKGGTLEIINGDGTVIFGPVIHDAIPSNGFFLTDFLLGDNATIFLFEPKEKKGTSSLTIKKVVHGYRHYLSNFFYGTEGASSPYNVDVACHPEYNKESGGVGLVMLSSGYELCSGALLMTTDVSFKSYFLTAFHCIDTDENGSLSNFEIYDSQNWMFKFHFKKSTCNGNALATSYTYSGSTMRAAWKNTDFALLELNYNLTLNPYLSWLGWDRSGTTPTNGAGIHHPCGDVMKISIEDNSFITDDWDNNNEYNHWYVYFDEGVAQGGSSGSPLLDQNKRVVGQLHGGDTIIFKNMWYGKFSDSWNGGGTDDTRLSNWLNPTGSNVQQTNTQTTTSLLSISGPTVPEINSIYSVNNLLAGYHVVWQYTGTTINSNDTATISNDRFVIDNLRKQYIKGTLTANIVFQGTVVRTLTKSINSGVNFSGTYSQPGGEVLAPIGESIVYPPIPPTTFYDSGIVEVHRVHTVTMTSSMFSNSTLSPRFGTFPIGWQHNGNTITFNYPRFGGGAIYDMTGTSNSSFDVYRFSIIAQADIPLLLNNLIISSENGTLTILLGNNMVSGESEETSMHQIADLNVENISVPVVITNILTGEQLYKGSIGGETLTISTASWPKGFYTLQVRCGDETISKKFIIK